jgi:hypothetical protein
MERGVMRGREAGGGGEEGGRKEEEGESREERGRGREERGIVENDAISIATGRRRESFC